MLSVNLRAVLFDQSSRTISSRTQMGPGDQPFIHYWARRLGRSGGIRSQQSSHGATCPVFAAALAPEVTVNCISPGLVEGTQMSAGAPDEFVALRRDRSILGATTSIGDVAQQVLTFCKSSSFTGQTVVIDGGIHLN